MTDIPPVTVRITEHRLHKVHCDCGQVATARAPGQAACSPTSYGPNLRASAVHLPAFKHVPVERAAPLIADVTGTRTSTGWTSGVLAHAAALVHDSLSPYAGYPNADHQLCGAHPIRELTAAEQDHSNQK